MPKKAKPKGTLAQLIAFYERMDKQDKEIIGAIALLVFFVIFAAVLANPIPFLIGVSVAGVLVFLGYLKIRTDLAPEHILAFGAVAVALITISGITLKAIDPYAGTGLIVSLVGGGAIAEVIKAKKKQNSGDS